MAEGRPRMEVAGVVQTLVARRLGRLLAPLGTLLLFGAGWAFLAGPGGRTVPLVVAVAAPLAAASAVACGLRTVRHALAAPPSAWAGAVSAGGVPVWLYGLTVLGLGLRGLAAVAGPDPWRTALPALVLVVLGGLVLRGWWRLGEVRGMVALLGRLPGDE